MSDSLQGLESDFPCHRVSTLKNLASLVASKKNRMSCYISLKRWTDENGLSQSLYDNHHYGQWTPHAFGIWEIVNTISRELLTDEDHSVRISAAVGIMYDPHSGIRVITETPLQAFSHIGNRTKYLS
jgi:hypothetical protein